MSEAGPHDHQAETVPQALGRLRVALDDAFLQASRRLGLTPPVTGVEASGIAASGAGGRGGGAAATVDGAPICTRISSGIVTTRNWSPPGRKRTCRGVPCPDSGTGSALPVRTSRSCTRPPTWRVRIRLPSSLTSTSTIRPLVAKAAICCLVRVSKTRTEPPVPVALAPPLTADREQLTETTRRGLDVGLRRQRVGANRVPVDRPKIAAAFP